VKIMTNRLVNENSPYLLQHAENPVDWYPWGDEALEKARREDKPIFLSIGYAACHWCHVMAHESFEDTDLGALMNQNFVNIKVDREERPDLDSIYMNAVVAMTGQGGWPMSVFLTPSGEPFYGGTYFPPVRRYNMPSFREVLNSVARLWRDDRTRLLQSGAEIAQHLQNAQLPDMAYQSTNSAVLDQAAFQLAQTYDWQHGGWGKAPKFPQPMAIEFLLRRAARGDKLAQDIAIHALEAMARGGMYDVVGGGFSRYSTDNNWLVPHFEKMLYDNAQLARVYLQAYMLTRKPSFLQACEETLDFLASEMLDSSGGMYSSLDADSEGEEGKYYLWSLEEIRSALATISWSGLMPDPVELIVAAYNIKQTGDFEGKIIFQRAMSNEELASQFGLSIDLVQPLLAEIHSTLRLVRSRRVPPATDDKILVAWNALALRAFAESARYLQRADYLAIAQKNAGFLLDELNREGRLMRSWRRGQVRHNAYLEDYAALILGLVALYQSDPDLRWYRAAVELTEVMIAHYSDPQGGFYDTRDDHDPLLLRPKDVQDNATPSGNALAVRALLEMALYTGKEDWRQVAEHMLGKIQAIASRHPTAFSQWLIALDIAVLPMREIAILGDLQNPATQSLITTLWSKYREDALVVISNYPPLPDAPALIQERPLVDSQPTAYVCQNFVCLRPVQTSQELLGQLEQPLRPL
jgi:uncharacterized protein YyaL (SSP411 family)